MSKKISFTKLGTVKSDDFEYTYEDFYQLMHGKITKDVNHNCVRYNEDKDCYEVMVDSTTYEVYCGKEKLTRQSSREDILKELEKLVSFTKEQEELLEREEEIEKTEEEKTDSAIENGEKGIFKSDDDKRKFIDYLKSRLRIIKPSLLMSLYYDRIGYKGHPGTYGRHLFLAILDIIVDIVLLCVFGVSIFATGGLIPFLLGTKAFIDVTGIIVKIIEYKGSGHSMKDRRETDMTTLPFTTLSNIIIAIIRTLGIFLINAFNLVKNVISELSDYRHEKRDIKRKIKALEKSLKHSQSKQTITQKGNELKIEEKIEVKEVLNPMEHSIKEISKELKALKSTILEINNMNLKKGYSEELLEILDYYKEASKTFEESGNYLMIHRQILNQLYSLRFRVEQTIRDEKKRQEVDDEFKIMLDEIDSVGSKSAGTKK